MNASNWQKKGVKAMAVANSQAFSASLLMNVCGSGGTALASSGRDERDVRG